VRLYEAIVLLPVTLTEKELQETTEEVEQVFTERGGKRLFKDAWGRQGLAYPIRKHREGQFLVYLFELSPSTLRAADSALRLEKNVLRHLIVKVPKNYEVTTFAERFESWQKDQERAKEQEEKEREEAVKQKIAKRPVRAAPEKAPASSATPTDGAAFEEKLGEIISDEDLKL
jgi:small subunit ribosomal protein S6